MPEKMPKNFEFKEAEARLYEWWETNGWFKPEVAPDDAEAFTVSMPPPNVTGALHIGHALFSTLEDLMIRYERMRGKAALWVPGTDHAGIATQLQVEKMLREQGLNRHEIGREEFIARTWEWKEKYGGEIIRQLRRLGASCDWERERFTLDDGLSVAVRDVFIALWDQGLVYRGTRLVNWSPGLQTAVSDLEVEREEENGTLYFFKYPVEGGEHLPVATTRPETILGDTAVAVHPDDERYKHLIGKKAYVPIINREIIVIADEYVDREFGTGALKVTPAHDFNDYELAKRHNLPMISIMNPDATLNDNAGDYVGLERFAAREKLWTDMTTAGLTIRTQDHHYVVPRSQRGGEVVEPMLSMQWFVKIQPLAEKALAAVKDGRIQIVPERFEKIYNHWLENIEDWCVSRQLWWGHRIPAWHSDDGEVYVGKAPPADDGKKWTPEQDVLDTWFSSGLWPFSTLGWPEKTPDLDRFYPTAVMETGYDILFFWVARMIMLGIWFTDEVPFKTVYLHGLVRDKHGRKISKTLGNVIDPLELVNQYGADPLRYALVTGSTPGNDISLDVARVERNWRFVNKIWQMSNFVTQNLDENLPSGIPSHSELDLPSRWILSRLNKLISTVQRLFDTYQYGEAGRQIDEFLWGDFADWYIEVSKHPLYQGNDTEKQNAQRVLLHVLDQGLRLLHPYMPFVTEEIWTYLPNREKALIISQWVSTDEAYIDEAAEQSMTMFIDLIRGIRNVRDEYNVEPSRKISAVVSTGAQRELFEQYGYLFSRLCNVSSVQLMAETDQAPGESASVVAGNVTVSLPLADFIDIAAECERLSKERDKLIAQAEKSRNTLSNEQFISRARPEIVDQERQKLASSEASIAQISDRLAGMCH